MFQQSRKDYLASLRDEIAAMKIVKCRMVHERVVELTDSKQLVYGNTWKRIGLCSPEIRSERLGCGHTMSRMQVDRAIGELEPTIAEPLRDELNWLTNQIHLLDHRKGEAESQKAIVQHNLQNGLEPLNELALVKALEREHDMYVERISVLRNRVLAEINKVISDIQ